MIQQKKIKVFSDAAWGLGVGGVGGLGMAVPVVVFLAAGFWLDSRYGTLPLFSILLGVFGMLSGLFSVYRWATNAVRFRMASTGRAAGASRLSDSVNFQAGSSFIKFAVSCGLAITVPLTVFLGLGYWLDSQFKTLPWLTIVFLHLGIGVGYFFVYKLTTSPARKSNSIPAEDQKVREGSEK